MPDSGSIHCQWVHLLAAGRSTTPSGWITPRTTSPLVEEISRIIGRPAPALMVWVITWLAPTVPLTVPMVVPVWKAMVVPPTGGGTGVTPPPLVMDTVRP